MSGAPPLTGSTGRALVQRLRSAAEVLLGLDRTAAVWASEASPGEQAGSLLGALSTDLVARPAVDRLWLVWTAVAAAFPHQDELMEGRRILDRVDPAGFATHLLEAAYAASIGRGAPELMMDVAVGSVVVDVDFCSRNEHHTGIQRVVRETVPRWVRDHEVTLVAWNDGHGAMREQTPEERERVLDWYGRQHGTTPGQRLVATQQAYKSGHGQDTRLVVPWRSCVVLPEILELERCRALAPLAEHSGNAVSVIGYDCIPAVSPELVHPGLPQWFAGFLTVVKHVDAVAGISASAAAEFRGFARMIPSQGLVGPVVTEVVLPIDVAAREPVGIEQTPADTEPAFPPASPQVLCVGSFEPRKNQLAVLTAAEVLWREGLHFQLLFIGGGGWQTNFEHMAHRLQERGRPISIRQGVSDDELAAAFAASRFTVFTTLHEGYGLPVAESLAYGVPVLTTSYGSTAEIAADGGCLTVDPRDDEALEVALRRMLVDDDLLDQLRSQARTRPKRSWDAYAEHAWTVLVDAAEAGRRRQPVSAGSAHG